VKCVVFLPGWVLCGVVRADLCYCCNHVVVRGLGLRRWQGPIRLHNEKGRHIEVRLQGQGEKASVIRLQTSHCHLTELLPRHGGAGPNKLDSPVQRSC
jgi:hypothetical protein